MVNINMSYKGNSYRVSEDHTGVTIKITGHIYHYRCYRQFGYYQHHQFQQHRHI